MITTVAISALTVSLGVTGWFIHKSTGMPYRVAAQPDGVNTWDNLTFAQPCNFLTNGPNFDDWCNIGNAPLKPPTTLLIGDSVSNNFAPVLQQYADRSGDPKFVFRQFGRGLCHGFAEIAMDNSRELTEAAKAYIHKTSSIDTIILAANWSLYYYGFERLGKTTVKSQEFKDAFEKNVAFTKAWGKELSFFSASCGRKP